MTTTSIVLSRISLPDRFSGLVRRAFRQFGRHLTAPESLEDARARRAFVQEMLSRDPGAFSSDLNIHFMMQHVAGGS